MLVTDIYFIVSSESSTYAPSSESAAKAAGAQPWNWAPLSRAIGKLEVGDELCVDNDISVFRISGKEVEYERPY